MKKWKREASERFALTITMLAIILLIQNVWVTSVLSIVALYSFVTAIIYLRRKQ